MSETTTETKEEVPFDSKLENAYPTIQQAWGILGLFLAITFVYFLPLGIISFFGFDIQTGPMLLVNYVLPLILLIFLCSYWWKKNPRNQNELSFRSFPVAIIPVLVVLTLALGITTNEITSWVPMPEFLLEIFKDALQLNVWGFLTVVVAASILEEILFRGIVLEGLLRNYSPFKAILWSSLFFGIFHLNPWQFVAAFMVGMAIGYLYWRTRSIWVGMLMHFINNGLAFLLMILYPEMESVNDVFHLGWEGRIIIFLLAVFIIWAAYKYFENFFTKKKLEV